MPCPCRTRASTRRHPLDAKFFDLIRSLRAAAAAAAAPRLYQGEGAATPGGGTDAARPLPVPPPDGGAAAGGTAEAAESSGGAAPLPPSPPSPTWMRFVRPDGATYAHNFADGARAEAPPEGGEIPALDAALVPRYDEDIMAAALAAAARRDADAVVATRLFTFRSWWFEGAEEADGKSNGEQVGGLITRQMLTIYFHLDTGLFELALENERSVGLQGLTSLTARGGQPVECWDLHVGAKLNMLGKPTTLLWADHATQLWIDFHSRRLRRIKAALEKQLRKYQTRPLPAALTFEKGSPFSGGTSLRALLEQIRKLRDTLAGFRPKLAQQLAAEDLLYRSSM